MVKIFYGPFVDSIDAHLKRVGYFFHCIEGNLYCYHRPLHDHAFPRFHAFISQKKRGLKVDLHIDAHDTLHHRGNHQQTWAYEGGRIEAEMSLISDSFEGQTIAQVSGAKQLKKSVQTPQPRKRLLDLFL